MLYITNNHILEPDSDGGHVYVEKNARWRKCFFFYVKKREWVGSLLPYNICGHKAIINRLLWHFSDDARANNDGFIWNNKWNRPCPFIQMFTDKWVSFEKCKVAFLSLSLQYHMGSLLLYTIFCGRMWVRSIETFIIKKPL